MKKGFQVQLRGERERETLRESGEERKREGGREGGRRRETQSALRLRAEVVRVPAAFNDVEEVHCSNCHRLDFSLIRSIQDGNLR